MCFLEGIAAFLSMFLLVLAYFFSLSRRRKREDNDTEPSKNKNKKHKTGNGNTIAMVVGFGNRFRLCVGSAVLRTTFDPSLQGQVRQVPRFHKGLLSCVMHMYYGLTTFLDLVPGTLSR